MSYVSEGTVGVRTEIAARSNLFTCRFEYFPQPDTTGV